MESYSEIIRYYTNSKIELNRLNTGHSQFEKARTQQILLRYLNQKPLKILDVGGGVGTYSFWLSEMGHEVHLIDPVPIHIEEAKKQSDQANRPLSSINVGEARNLQFKDSYFDIVLLFGPLYHLIKKEERISALLEAKKVARKDAKIFCVSISRYAFLFDVFFHDIMKVNSQSMSKVESHFSTGQIRNSGEQTGGFTTAYAHQEGELGEEIVEAGLNLDQIIAIDGFGWLIPNFEQKWQNEEYRQALLNVSQTCGNDKSILGMSAHIMTIASKIR
jgi:ubiquinone/menaquinone biosynthesis C-methylase UbiE